MTLARRIIPCLDVDAGRVVKGIEFAGLRDMGDPAELAARYNAEGADELVVLDISASVEGRATFLDTIRRVAEQLNIPLTAGGGIRTMEDGQAVLRAGADKVTVNTAAVARPELLSELANQFGSQAVVLSVDVKRKGAGWEAYVRGGRGATGMDAAEWVAKAVSLGAGEILVTSIDRDGTCSGFDCERTAKMAETVSVPVIASGGANTFDDFLAVFEGGRADAALAASIFHTETHSIESLKSYLSARGVPIRLPMNISDRVLVEGLVRRRARLRGDYSVHLFAGRKSGATRSRTEARAFGGGRSGIAGAFSELSDHACDRSGCGAAHRKQLAMDQDAVPPGENESPSGRRNSERGAREEDSVLGRGENYFGQRSVQGWKSGARFFERDGAESGARKYNYRAGYRGRADRRARLAGEAEAASRGSDSRA